MLYLGDCLDVLRGLPDASVDAVVTDPPYKISQEYSVNADPDNLLAVSCIWIASEEMLRVTKPGGICAMFYDTRILPLALHTMKRAGWKYLRALTFYRKWGQCNLLNGWMSSSDFILVYAKPGEKPKWHGTPRHDVYVRESPEREQVDHPARKPIDALRHLVSNVCPLGGVVLDPFMGSGSVGVAAMHEGREFIGIEQSAEYFALAERRIAGVTQPSPNGEQPPLFTLGAA